MKNFKRVISVMLACLLMFSMVACSGGSDKQTETKADGGKPEYTFNLAMDSSEDTVTYLFAEKFKNVLEEKTNGKIVVQLYSNGQLGGDREIAESVQAGNIDFAVQTTAPQVNFIPELAVFDMPSVFPNAKIARAALDSSFFNTVSDVYEESGFKLLGFVDQGFRTMSSNKKVENIEDFKGQKIRTMENPYHIAYWRAIGANPTPMAFSEVYIGLQQGTIDAQENPYEVIVSNKLYEQQKYVINTNHIFHIISLITNPNRYNGLSKEYQKAIDEAAAEAKQWAREQADKRVADRVKIMTDNGVEIVDLTPELHEQMKKKAESVYDTIRSEIGNELVDSLFTAVEEAKGK